jgi:hypothetical protein
MNSSIPLAAVLRRALTSPWILLALLMLAALVLRLPGLERFVVNENAAPCCTLGGDESYTLRTALMPLDYILRLPDNGNQWLLYLFSHFWLRLIGAPSNAALRIVPLAFSIASIPAVYVAVRELVRVIVPHTRLGAERVALVATAFLTFHPMHIFYATEFRSHSATLLLCACTTYLAARMIGTALGGTAPRLRSWLLLGVAHGAAIYLHMLSAIYWVALVAVILSVAPLVNRATHSRLVVGAIASGGVMTLIASRLLLTVIHVGAKQISWIGPLDPPQAATFALRFLGSGVVTRDYLFNLPAAIVVALLVGGTIVAGRLVVARGIDRNDRRAWWGWFAPIILVGAPPIIGCIMSIALTPVLLPRYFIWLLIPVGFLFSLSVDTLTAWADAPHPRRNLRRFLLATTLAGALAAMVAGYVSPPGQF